MEQLNGLKILVVEDDPTVRLLVKKSLENKGGVISEAATAREAQEKAMNKSLDIIILDLNLPDGTG